MNEATPNPLGRESFNIPNLITFSRLILTFVLLALIDIGGMWITCTVIFVIAVITDVIDGYLARAWDQITVLGRITDPFVDKVIIGGTLIFLTNQPQSGIDPWITLIVIGREMFVTGLRSVLEGHGVDFSAQWTGKLKMLIQSITIPLCLISLSPEFINLLAENKVGFLSLRDWLVRGMVGITLYSGLEYTWRGLRLLSETNVLDESDNANI